MLSRNWQMLLRAGIVGRGSDLIDVLGWVMNGESFTPTQLMSRLNCNSFHANMILDHLFGAGVTTDSGTHFGKLTGLLPPGLVRSNVDDREKAMIIVFMSRFDFNDPWGDGSGI